MSSHNLSLWSKIEPLLAHVEKPSRYIGSEFNSVYKADCDYRAVFVYPDTYEIGASNQAISILYDVANRLDGVFAERAFLPWLDMISLLREQGIPLFSLESCSALGDFDLIGITIPHELAATNILEVLDLAGLPLRSSERGEGYPLVIGGGPGAINPEPLAGFFDAIAIGEGEELIAELIEVHRRLLAAGVSRQELLVALSAIEGVYVPGVVTSKLVRRRVYQGFSDEIPLLSLVPYCDIVHDRLAIELLRGCTRGCRFCQAGMTYRPVRERRSDLVVSAVTSLIDMSGFDEVSLTSLSSTDHSQIEPILRRLGERYRNTGISISIPSQRLDAFGVHMAELVSGEKKSGLTFAPEAGSQRLRDVINKNVTEDDLFSSVEAAFSAGWRRCKLYFMIGLPTETEEDVLAIADLVERAYRLAMDCLPTAQRGQVRMSVSVAVFVPKAATPFQWCGQLPMEEAERRIQLLRQAHLPKGVELNWHDPRSAQVEAALARGGREAGALVEAAWRAGGLFAAWTKQFDYEVWSSAAAACGLDLAEMAERVYLEHDELPWRHIDSGVSVEYLWREWQRALAGQTTEDCSFADCQDCGVCVDGVDLVLAGVRHG